MRILDVYADDLLTICTQDKKFSFSVGDDISITMIDGFVVSGTIEKINVDDVVIHSNNATMKYHLEKFAYINK